MSTTTAEQTQPIAVGDHVHVGKGKKAWKVIEFWRAGDGPLMAQLEALDKPDSHTSVEVARLVRLGPTTSGPGRAPDEPAGKTGVGSEPASPGPESPLTDPPGVEPVAMTVHAAADPRLQQLHAAWPDLKSQAESAAKALKDCTDSIKAQVTGLDPEQRRFDLVGEGAPALRVTYSESWRFDSKRMKRDIAGEPDETLAQLAASVGVPIETVKAVLPLLFVRYSYKSGSWSLRAGGGE